MNFVNIKPFSPTGFLSLMVLFYLILSLSFCSLSFSTLPLARLLFSTTLFPCVRSLPSLACSFFLVISLLLLLGRFMLRTMGGLFGLRLLMLSFFGRLDLFSFTGLLSCLFRSLSGGLSFS